MTAEVRVPAEVRANLNPLTAPIDDREFRKLADHIPTLCWIADAEGYIVWYNRRWYEYTGKTPAEMEGWGWQSVHDPRNLAQVLERWRHAIASAEPFEMVFPIRGADGVFRPFLTRINPAFDEHGAVTNWFGVNTDISLQVQAEDAYAKSQTRFRVLADGMPQMVWSARPDGFLDYHNARWYEFTGAPVGATDGYGWTAMLHREDSEPALATWRGSLETGDTYHVECRLLHRSGEYRWVLCRAHAERDAEGLVTRWYGTCTDIEDIVQARNVLKRSRDELELAIIARTGERNLLAKIVETTDVMITAYDLDCKILAINPAGAREFHHVYGHHPRVGDNILALLADLPEQQESARESMARGVAGEEITFIATLGDPARACRQYEITFRKLCDDAGNQIGFFQFAKDVTERLRDQAMLAQAQAALLHSQKLEAMGQLTGGVAHDFNNLLTPIVGSLDMLRRRGIGGPREQRLINGAFQSAERAKTLVHRLLAFARRQPLQSVAVDIGALIREMADLVSGTTGPQVTLKVEIADDLPPAKADPHQLEMAILNLSVNARDAMNGAGRITISAAHATVAATNPVEHLAPGSYVRLTVADNGRGMDEATRARAVEPFFSTKGVGQGTGLGLSMAHGLACQLGGALTITSALGVGTEVSMWLPVTPQPAPQPENGPRLATETLLGGTALLVDDEEYIRLSTADMLTELGFSVHEAASAEAALLAIEAGLQPDILITDHLMPGMTGVQLAHAVRDRHPGTKVLIVSGFAESDGIDPSLPRLTKPFIRSDLATALADLRSP
jgi:PAS domain S-box-containing protein